MKIRLELIATTAAALMLGALRQRPSLGPHNMQKFGHTVRLVDLVPYSGGWQREARLRRWAGPVTANRLLRPTPHQGESP